MLNFKVTKPRLKSTSIITFVGAYAVTDHGDSPRYARFEITQAFIDRLYEVHALCVNGIRSVTFDEFPDEWSDEEDLRLRNRGLVVDENGFYFEAYPKYFDYGVETRYISFFDFEVEIERALNEGAKEIFFEGITKDEIAELAVEKVATA